MQIRNRARSGLGTNVQKSHLCQLIQVYFPERHTSKFLLGLNELTINRIHWWKLVLILFILYFSTHNGKILRRSVFIFGFIALSLLIIETGWEVTKSVNDGYFPEMWPFNYNNFNDSTIWFNALVQVIFSTNIGIGALPVLSGKLLYKGDAVR